MKGESSMLDNKGFDLWANGYEQSVGASEDQGTYPFAGYNQILSEIYNKVLAGKGKTVLDIGFGTGTLATKLYNQGFNVWGQDFSEKMIELARKRMPEARLYQGDFMKGLVPELKQNTYDAIVATYSLHHLTDEKKVTLIKELLLLLNDEGCIYIGDVAFGTRAELENCKALLGNEWDDDEFYFVADELAKSFSRVRFDQFSFCSGLLSLKR